MKNSMLLLLMVIMLLSMSSRCKKEEAKFTPLFYIGDPLNDQIINRNGEVVSCQEENFKDYGCLHIDKINELRRILKKRCK